MSNLQTHNHFTLNFQKVDVITWWSHKFNFFSVISVSTDTISIKWFYVTETQQN